MTPRCSPAAYPRTAWVEHFEWLEPLFNEQLELREGRMFVPDRPGLGLSLSERATAWTVDRCEMSAADRVAPAGAR
ncbi:hypothetical protein [Streptomyces inhibens]|uniref:hypothetical protein n=1 Tax=Streptomyces inhibens TaxID=2293571 RepID=UPI0026B20E56